MAQEEKYGAPCSSGRLLEEETPKSLSNLIYGPKQTAPDLSSLGCRRFLKGPTLDVSEVVFCPPTHAEAPTKAWRRSAVITSRARSGLFKVI